MWPIHILTRQGADTHLVCPSFFSDTASYRCALGLNHRLFLLTCHPTKREGKKRPHQSTLLCVKKNKAGGRGGCQKMTSVILCRGLVSDSQIPLWSFVDLWVSLISRRILDISFQDSRSNKCSPTPQEPFVDLVFRWSNEGVASKAGTNLSIW